MYTPPPSSRFDEVIPESATHHTTISLPPTEYTRSIHLKTLSVNIIRTSQRQYPYVYGCCRAARKRACSAPRIITSDPHKPVNDNPLDDSAYAGRFSYCRETIPVYHTHYSHMADRTCNTCGKVFRAPSYLRDHAARKTPCTPILGPQDHPPEVLEDPDLESKKCRFCGRVFSSRTSMLRHVRQNCKIVPNVKNGDEGLEKLYEHTIRQQGETIATLQAEMAQMRENIRAITERGEKRQDITIKCNNLNNQVNNVNINVKLFGQESQDHVTGARIREVLDNCLRTPGTPATNAILQVAMLVYSDPNHPENLTAYLPNKKTDDVLVHGEKGWEVRPARLVLRPMAETTIDALFDKQPHEDADQYGPLMQELRDNENRYAEGAELRPVLIRNKDLLRRALAALPSVSE